MGTTLSDMHRRMYNGWVDQGFSHEETINKVPKGIKEQFIKDINKSSIESHFGVKDKWFFVIMAACIIIPIIIGIFVV